jgi:branched-chain amino acid transport system permease protein
LKEMALSSIVLNKRYALWGAGALLVWLLLCLPQLFGSSLALSMLSQMGYLIIICLSYNILLGQGGMLSFGHAVYTGLGAFMAVHVMNRAALADFAVPLMLVPVLGGLAGLACAVLLGFAATRKSATVFSMITLGLAELVAAVALMFPAWFGGESGISSNRVYGTPWLGFTFGPALEVYYLIAAYALLCTLAMWCLTQTPLGRILNAVRDNPERAAFIGYNPQRVRHIAFSMAGFFAGIGGALAAIHLEMVTAADSFSLARSGHYLLFTFLGGAAFFAGPILGAVLMVLTLVWWSELSAAWLLYLGLVFIGMVMLAPGGLAALWLALWRYGRSGQWRTEWRWRVLQGTALGLVLAGSAVLVELAYHRQQLATLGPELHLWGWALRVDAWQHWWAAALAAGAGLGLAGVLHRRQRAAAQKG